MTLNKITLNKITQSKNTHIKMTLRKTTISITITYHYDTQHNNNVSKNLHIETQLNNKHLDDNI